MIVGVGSLDAREARGRADHRVEDAVSAMLLAVARHDQRSLVDLLLKGVFHLRMIPLERTAVDVQVLAGGAVVLVWATWLLGLLHLHLLPDIYVSYRPPLVDLLHHKRNVMRIK